MKKCELIKGPGRIVFTAKKKAIEPTCLIVFVDGPWADTFQRLTHNDLPITVERLEEVQRTFGPGKASFAGMTFQCADVTVTRQETTHTYQLVDAEVTSAGRVGFYKCQ